MSEKFPYPMHQMDGGKPQAIVHLWLIHTWHYLLKFTIYGGLPIAFVVFITVENGRGLDYSAYFMLGICGVFFIIASMISWFKAFKVIVLRDNDINGYRLSVSDTKGVDDFCARNEAIKKFSNLHLLVVAILMLISSVFIMQIDMREGRYASTYSPSLAIFKISGAMNLHSDGYASNRHLNSHRGDSGFKIVPYVMLHFVALGFAWVLGLKVVLKKSFNGYILEWKLVRSDTPGPWKKWRDINPNRAHTSKIAARGKERVKERSLADLDQE